MTYGDYILIQDQDMNGGPLEFEFPKNLKDMSWEERQKLHERYLAHVSTASGPMARNVIELDVVAEDEPGPDAAAWPPLDVEPQVASGATFDPEKGYVVSGEDPWLLASMGRITPEEAEAMAAKGAIGTRAVSDDEVAAAKSAEVRKKVASLPASSRDAVERFGRI